MQTSVCRDLAARNMTLHAHAMRACTMNHHARACMHVCAVWFALLPCVHAPVLLFLCWCACVHLAIVCACAHVRVYP